MSSGTETRNLIDHYHYWKNEAIIADLDTKRHPFAVLLSNIGYDFNIATAIRNANAFLAERVFIYGRRQWDRRGAVGTHTYQHITHITEEQGIGHLLNDYTLVGIDNVDGAVPIQDLDWPERPLLCFGQEQIGLPQDLLDQCAAVTYIKQYGSVRSLNVGTASGIAMYEWCRANK